ncbi:hypothetical protein WN48_03332, partial [Eufriesea mexicana]
VQQKIINIIKRFKFEDLELSVMPIFPETSWANIRSNLVKYNEKFSSSNVAQLIKIAITVSQKYFFSTNKNVSFNILDGIAKSLGFEGSKRFKLMGKDIKSLSELCWRKKEGTINYKNINKNLVFKDGAPDRKETGISFTQQKQRRRYAEKCFGDNPPTLEVLVINRPGISLSQKDVTIKLPNENIHVTWEFRSRNIATCLTKLIERRILNPPVPYYISNLMMLGKNEFTLQNN